jgi:hypothetical protein
MRASYMPLREPHRYGGVAWAMLAFAILVAAFSVNIWLLARVLRSEETTLDHLGKWHSFFYLKYRRD